MQASSLQSPPFTKSVLVVDDQPDVREALRLLLKSAGYATQMAASPDEAFTLAQASSPDLIVLDMNYASDTTSGREGILLIDRLCHLNAGVPIIAMTGWSTIELAVEAMQHGACDFITKPWDIHHLLAMFDKQLRAAAVKKSVESARASEIAIAQRVQQKLLPPRQFTAAGLAFDCAFLPFSEVGGDLYDFFEHEGCVGFLVGDVSGKGMAQRCSLRLSRPLFEASANSSFTPPC